MNINTYNNYGCNTQKGGKVPFRGKKEGLFTRVLNQTFGLDEFIAKGTAKLSQTKASKCAVNTIRKFKNPTARLSDLESFAITFFYVQRTAKNKKLKKERKVPSILQNILVTLVSTTAAALLDKACDPAIDALTTAYSKLPADKIKKLGGKSPKEFHDAARIFKSSTVFTAVVRFIVPVMMVPVVGSLVRKIKGKTNNKQALQQTLQAPAPVFKNNAEPPVQSLKNLSQINTLNQNLANTKQNKFASLFMQA